MRASRPCRSFRRAQDRPPNLSIIIMYDFFQFPSAASQTCAVITAALRHPLSGSVSLLLLCLIFFNFRSQQHLSAQAGTIFPTFMSGTSFPSLLILCLIFPGSLLLRAGCPCRSVKDRFQNLLYIVCLKFLKNRSLQPELRTAAAVL